MRGAIRKLDAFLGEMIGRLPESWHTWLNALSIVASPPAWAVVALIGAGVASYKSDYFLTVLSAGVLIALPLSEFIKMLVRRQRPVSLYVETMRLRSYSFPSSHAYGASLGAGYLLVYAAQFVSGPGLYVLAAVLAGIVVMIALSRVYLKAHFPSDVIAGLGMGVLVVILIVGWVA